MRYSVEFKNTVLSRVMSGEVTVAQASEQYGVSTFSIRAWLKKVSEAAQTGTDTPNLQPKEKASMSKLQLPKGISYLEAHKAVVAQQLLNEADFGAYCRKNGILAADVEEWAKWFQNHPQGCSLEELKSERRLRQKAQSDAAEANRNLARKDKALSDATTMLILAKKAEALWGFKGD